MSSPLIALDIGTVRIGMAIAEPETNIAMPLTTIHIRHSDDPYREIADIIEEVRPEALESWEIFDVYRGKQILPGLQSISLSMRYRHAMAHDAEQGRPLSDDEVNKAHATIVEALNSRLSGQLR